LAELDREADCKPGIPINVLLDQGAEPNDLPAIVLPVRVGEASLLKAGLYLSRIGVDAAAECFQLSTRTLDVLAQAILRSASSGAKGIKYLAKPFDVLG
jgi:hypothetical protein